MRERDWSATDLRRHLKAPSGKPLAGGIVDRLLYGDTKAPIGLAAQLEELLGVPAASWARSPTRQFVLAAASRIRSRTKVRTRKAPRKTAKRPSGRSRVRT